jgi:uncharacterized membrane protein (DUF2068 family)
VQSFMSRRGVRAVAILESIKGFLASILGICLLLLLRSNMHEGAQKIIAYLHLNNTDRYAQWLLKTAANTTGKHLIILALCAGFYAAVRFVEAYGLWRGRRWAEWFAAVSASIYIPIELYELSQNLHWITVVVLLINIFVVVYMLRTLSRSRAKIGNF